MGRVFCRQPSKSYGAGPLVSYRVCCTQLVSASLVSRRRKIGFPESPRELPEEALKAQEDQRKATKIKKYLVFDIVGFCSPHEKENGRPRGSKSAPSRHAEGAKTVQVMVSVMVVE